ncbi:MAG: MarC family protein [Sulfurospirillaceae bacterium]|jgi:multiple antibiotic resistance protein|nr:MarC family protein [Sulfurospirillaceae bacterium]MCK9546610.1 MarC family protein [Sulfurospirillaceae bacterium]NLM98516.1 MarC family protein [Campylobacteraceae bacterium]
MIFTTYIKFFFLMTPFFSLLMFLILTKNSLESRKKLALKTTLTISILVSILLFFGNHIFFMLGITLEAFRVGAGALLFITAISLINGPLPSEPLEDINSSIVVPLAIPITIGPGTIGAILVMGASLEETSEVLKGWLALYLAVFSIGLLLYFANEIEKVTKKSGLIVLSKITGLVLAALSAQMVLSGIKGFFEI